MTSEERIKRKKEAYKAHYRELKALRAKARQVRYRNALSSAMNELNSSIQGNMNVHDEYVDRLENETAASDARLEIAMEASPAPLDPEQELKDELRRADALLAQMQAEEAGESGTTAAAETPVSPPSVKTIGQMPEVPPERNTGA